MHLVNIIPDYSIRLKMCQLILEHNTVQLNLYNFILQISCE